MNKWTTPIYHYSCIHAKATTMCEIKQAANEVNWTRLDFPGVQIKVLHTEERTGTTTVHTRLAPGAAIPRHRHTSTDETVYVIEGDSIEDDETFGTREPAQFRIRLISPRSKASSSAGACQTPASSWNGYSWFRFARAPFAGYSGTSESSPLTCSTTDFVKTWRN
jgi:hypothetical protein